MIFLDLFYLFMVHLPHISLGRGDFCVCCAWQSVAYLHYVERKLVYLEIFFLYCNFYGLGNGRVGVAGVSIFLSILIKNCWF